MIMIEKPFFEKLPAQKPQQSEEKEIFKPNWNCFCCHDSGFIIRTELVIESLGRNDPGPVCNRPGCTSASRFGFELDRRVPPEVCQQIHEWELSCWKSTVHSQWEKIVEKINSLASSKSISDSSRSKNDEGEIVIRKEAQAELDEETKELDEIDF